MKHDLSIILRQELLKKYSLEESKSVDNVLYKYLYIKCSIKNNKKKIDYNELILFILEELNIDYFDGESIGNLPYVIYEEEKYYLYEIGRDFLDNLRFRASLEGSVDYKKELLDTHRKGYSKSYKYKDLKTHNMHVQYNRLLELNRKFNVNPKSSEGVKGFLNSSNHNPFKRTLEENLISIIEADKFSESTTTTYISEKTFEDYLIDHLNLIEEDLVFLDRQIDVNGGTIDILAKDRNSNLCIIEVKIKEDKRIVWQALYYPDEIKSKYNTDYIRMLTVAPKYSNHIMKSLSSIEGVEMFDYDINVTNGKIDKLKVNKVN